MNVSPIVVEDGTNIEGANSYCDVDFADQYFADNPNPGEWPNAALEVKKKALLYAARLLDRIVIWNGKKLHRYGQAMEWPRAMVLSRDGGYYLDTNTVPRFVQEAQCEMAKVLLVRDVQEENELQSFKKIKLDVLEIEVDNTNLPQSIPNSVRDFIAGYGVYVWQQSGFRKVRV